MPRVRRGESVSKVLYAISPRPDVDFHVGRTNKGQQVVLGVIFSGVVAYIFDSDGRFLSRVYRPWEPPESADILSFQQSQHSQFRANLDHRMSELRQQLDVKVKEELITIEEFFDAGLFVGIQSIPMCLVQAAKNETQSEYQDRCSERDAWIDSGRFVFWWTTDCWLSNGNFKSLAPVHKSETPG